MCGIVAVLDIASGDVTKLRSQVLKMSDKLRHRGPDWSGIYKRFLRMKGFRS